MVSTSRKSNLRNRTTVRINGCITSLFRYISFSSILIFVLPLALIIYFYYHILNKLREALKGSKRMRRAASSRAPYHRVTRLVLWVVVFHVICWYVLAMGKESKISKVL